MTENSIVKTFMKNNHRERYIVANLFFNGFESDMLRAVPKGGGEFDLTEYEVKLSKADLKKDKHKSYSFWKGGIYRGGVDSLQQVYKHNLLSEGKRVNKYYYIMPRDLWEKIYKSKEYKELIPEWAGVTCCWKTEYDEIVFQKHKNAKSLSKGYFKIGGMLMDKFYYAYWNLKIKK